MRLKTLVLRSTQVGIACLLVALVGSWLLAADANSAERGDGHHGPSAPLAQLDRLFELAPQAGFAWNDVVRRQAIGHVMTWMHSLP